jgi:hypothetical protein
MGLYVLRLISRWCAAVLLAVAAQWFIAPQNAEAKCGDYVLIAGHGSAHVTMPAHHDVADARQPDGTPLPAAPDRHCPCSGPSCSNGNQHPLAPPTAPFEMSVRESGVINALPATSVAGSELAWFADESRSPRLIASSLFRPPRW